MKKTLDVIHENPYQLVYDIEGFGFERADQLAIKLGVVATAEVRLAVRDLCKYGTIEPIFG